ncbi:MAG: hypothetical protein KGZ88_07715 [Methylomicrobium sp.]|nr:hypothetical protein [Methylomicrobium sp.]
MALTETDNNERRFVRISQLDLTDQQAVRGSMKDFPPESTVRPAGLLPAGHKTNKDGSTGLSPWFASIRCATGTPECRRAQGTSLIRNLPLLEVMRGTAQFRQQVCSKKLKYCHCRSTVS